MKKIAVFLFEGAELFEIASFTDIFGWNNVVGLKEFRDIKLETISYKESIKCTWGGNLRVEKVITEENIEEFFCYDALIIPGGFGRANFFEDKNNEIFTLAGIALTTISLIPTKEIITKITPLKKTKPKATSTGIFI